MHNAYAVVRCPSVSLSVRLVVCRVVYSVETSKNILKIVSPSGSHIIYFFHTKR